MLLLPTGGQFSGQHRQRCEGQFSVVRHHGAADADRDVSAGEKLTLWVWFCVPKPIFCASKTVDLVVLSFGHSVMLTF